MSSNTTSKEFVCVLHGKKISDMYMSDAKCLFANITIFLYDYGFGYLCFALLFIIVIISLFGKIKADYKWFILNQAVWDIAITYGYLRNDGIYKYVEKGSVPATYVAKTYVLDKIYKDIIDTNPFTSLLLLSWSRFLALYYSHFYDRITSKKRIFFTIIGFNFIVCFFHLSALIDQIRLNTYQRLMTYCNEQAYPKCQQWSESQFVYVLLRQLFNIFRFIVLLKPLIFLCLSIFAAIMIMVKIGKQAKFQLKHNRRDFFVSLRISSVIFFQTIINCILVFLEFTESIDDVFRDVFNYTFEKHKPCAKVIMFVYSGCLDFLQLPEWLDDDQYRLGLESPTIYPTFKQLRIFLESIIIIAVMAGYREAIIKLVKYLYSFVKKPKRSAVNNSRLFVNRSSLGANVA